MKVTPCIILSLGFLCGCTTQEIYRNFYDGIKDRNKTVRSAPLETLGGPAPSYEEYERERKNLSSPN